MKQFTNGFFGGSKGRFIHVISISSSRSSLGKTRSFNVNKVTTSALLQAHHIRLSVYSSSHLSLPRCSDKASRQLLPLPTVGRKALLGSWARRNRIRPVKDDDVEGDIAADAEEEVEGYFSKLYMNQQRGGSGVRDDDELDDGGEQGELSYSEKQYQMRQALLAQRGRLWSDPLEISDQDFNKSVWWDDIPDWSPDVVSSISLERVKVLDHLPGLSELASKIELPPPPPVLPSADPKAYVKHRKRTERQRIHAKVCQLAKERVEEIIRIADKHEKQNAVDELFEYIEQQMREEEGVLLVKRSTKVRRRKSPPAKFEMMVEHALTEYLQEINKREEKAWLQARNEIVGQPPTIQDVDSISNAPDGTEKTTVKPLFVDLATTTMKNIFAVSGVSGELKEEWELAALKSSQRIMLRKCMADMAKEIWEKVVVEEKPFKIFIQGRKGVGKSSALTLLAAAARESGYIVLFLPDGDRYRKNGKYIEPCTIHHGMFNLPVLAKEMCEQLLEVHGEQLDSLGLCATSEHSLSYLGDELVLLSSSKKLTDLLRLGVADVENASGCYSCVVATLMEQTEAPFIVFMDEYNTYFEKGEYFHEAYDSDVVHPIPVEKISFFQPFLSIGAKNKSGSADMMKRGGIVAAITYNRSVAKWATEGLINRVSQEADVFVVDVPRYSKLEVEHVLANYECTGVGKLRFDNGKTISDDQEVEFLRMMSGAVGTRLLDATIWSMYA